VPVWIAALLAATSLGSALRRVTCRGLGLPDALDVLVLMEELDDTQFERAAVRWISRFAGECPCVGLGELLAALEALDGLPARDAYTTLRALLTRHGA
jgi:hypothetical protein